ncbi:MAG: alpha-amylase family glycosyl hydrolase, partial [Saprospiraceae bacterium]
MSETITQTLPLGVSISDGKTRLRVWAPHAKAVAVTGSFNDWNEKGISLKPSEDAGFWQLSTKKISVGDEYQYVITGPNDERLMRNDPRARLLTNSSGNTIVTEDDFDWGDDNYQIPAWNELVIYEMHIGTFNVVEAGRPGTFLTAIERLDYLKDLGINLIEVMPVAEFAGDFSWGYNPAYPFSVEEAYGGPTGLKQFVKEAHARGMGVVMDVVYNHFGPSDMSMWQFDGWHENDKGGIYFYNDW